MLKFKNRFFSKAGLKERGRNIVDVYKIALNPFSRNRIKANVKNKTLKKGLELVANNPYKTAAVIAGGVTAARYALPAAKALIAKTGAAKIGGAAAGVATGAAISGGMSRTLLAAGAGAAAGFIARGGGSSTAPQRANPTQDSRQDNRQYSEFMDNRSTRIIDSPGASAGMTGATFTPTQTPGFNPSQSTAQGQTAAEGINPLILIGGAVAAAMILKN